MQVQRSKVCSVPDCITALDKDVYSPCSRSDLTACLKSGERLYIVCLLYQGLINSRYKKRACNFHINCTVRIKKLGGAECSSSIIATLTNACWSLS